MFIQDPRCDHEILFDFLDEDMDNDSQRPLLARILVEEGKGSLEPLTWNLSVLSVLETSMWSNP